MAISTSMSGVQKVKGLEYQAPNLSGLSLKSATTEFKNSMVEQNQEVETFDFDEPISQEKEPSLLEKIGDCGENLLESIQSFGQSILDTGAEIADNVSSWFESTPVGEWLSDAYSNLTEAINTAGATLSAAVVGLLEGIGKVGESVVDLGVIAVGCVLASGATFYDFLSYLASQVTGEEMEFLSAKIMDFTKSIVEVDATKSFFDNIYDQTKIGNWIKENALGFDTVRGVSSGIGYTAGIVGLTLLTGGIAGAVTGASVGVGSGSLALTAGMLGFSKGTEKAWKEGSSVLQGLAYGAVSGGWEGLQFFLGAKIGSTSVTSSSKFLGKMANAGSRIALDSADGGVEGFVQPLMDMIIHYDASESFTENYKSLFEESGGMSNVFTQAIIGGGSSFLGEAFDLGKYFKDSKGKDSIKIEGMESSMNQTLEVDSPNVENKRVEPIIKQETEKENIKVENKKTEPIAERIMKEASKESDYGSMKMFYDVVKKMKESKDETSVKIAENIDHLLNASNISSLSFLKTPIYKNTSFHHGDSAKYGLGSAIFDEFGRSLETYTHEVGHLLNNFNGIKIPKEFDEVSSKVIQNMDNNAEKIKEFLNHVKEYKLKTIPESLKRAQEYINKIPKEEIDQFVNDCLSSKDPLMEIEIQASQAGFSKNKIDTIVNEAKNGITDDVKYQIGRIYKIKVANILTTIDYENDHEMMLYNMITGIIDSVYNGKNPYYYSMYAPNAMRSHGPEYFQKKQTNGFDEQFADYVSLRLNSDVYQPATNYLKKILGEDWFEMMDKHYKEIGEEIAKTNTKLEPIKKDN